MSCQHREDVCQHCLEKVQTTTEDSPPTKLSPTEKSPPEKTITPEKKRKLILFHSAILSVLGYGAYLNAKFFLKIFDSSVFIVNNLLDTIGTRTRKE